MASDIEIAQAATPKPITEIAEALNIPDEALEPYGRIKGKVNLVPKRKPLTKELLQGCSGGGVRRGERSE